MRDSCTITSLSARTTRRRRLVIALGLLFASVFGPVYAQQDQSQQADVPIPSGPMYTLHVFANLIQLPTLVLHSNLTPIASLIPAQFNLSVDSGPVFHPTKIRIEGEDPITIGLLIDVGGSQASLNRVIAAAMAGLAPLSLTPRDRVAVFAFDCLIASAPGARQASAETLSANIEAAMNKLTVPGHSVVPACNHQHHVLDAIATVARAISTVPGRRVILAVTDGFDLGSINTWREVHQFALTFGISIFGVQTDSYPPDPFRLTERRASEDAFTLLCNGSGGLVLETSRGDLPKTLKHVIDLLRARYIIEFPRPSNSTSGHHLIDVKIPHRDAIIRASGVVFPLPGDTELYDPDTVAPNSTLAPIQGKRKIITRP